MPSRKWFIFAVEASLIRASFSYDEDADSFFIARPKGTFGVYNITIVAKDKVTTLLLDCKSCIDDPLEEVAGAESMIRQIPKASSYLNESGADNLDLRIEDANYDTLIVHMKAK